MIPGQAKREPGPITTDLVFVKDWSNSLHNHGAVWLWVPAFAGTTIMGNGCFIHSDRFGRSLL